MSKEINQHLNCVLKSHNIENDSDLITAYRNKKSDLKDALINKFGSDCYYPFDSGSYKKSTAINSKFDLDICLPFKKNGNTLKANFEKVYSFFDSEYDDSELVGGAKKQKVSIGLNFYSGGKHLDFDIVPGREINNYQDDHDLNLYFNESMGIIVAKSYLKTNIHKQIDHIRNNNDAREVIKLLKVWRRHSGTSVKSFLIELLAIRAFEDNEGNLPTDIWGKLKMTLEYIHNKINDIRLLDPGNSNNNVADSLSEYQKINLSVTANRIIEAIERRNSAIESYFPVNPDYPCNQESKSPYIVVGTGATDRIPDADFG